MLGVEVCVGYCRYDGSGRWNRLQGGTLGVEVGVGYLLVWYVQ